MRVCSCNYFIVSLCVMNFVIDFDKFEAKLEKTLKKFTAKPIQQLAVIPEHHIFLLLTSEFCYPVR